MTLQEKANVGARAGRGRCKGRTQRSCGQGTGDATAAGRGWSRKGGQTAEASGPQLQKQREAWEGLKQRRDLVPLKALQAASGLSVEIRTTGRGTRQKDGDQLLLSNPVTDGASLGHRGATQVLC